MFIGFNMLYFAMLVLGLQGMPRRYYAPPAPVPHRATWSPRWARWFLALGLLMFFGNFVHALFKGEKAEDNPWGGVTLEWTIPIARRPRRTSRRSPRSPTGPTTSPRRPA